MYNANMPGSILHNTIRAVSLATFSNNRPSASLHREAQKMYGNVILELGSAILNPQTVMDDQNIMSILLFGLFEVSNIPYMR